MPELAEVEYFRSVWAAGCGEKILRVRLHSQKRIFRKINPRQLARELAGSKLLTAEARGKQMLFKFSGDRWLGIHLGMSGKLFAGARGHIPEKHEHLVLYQARRALIFSDMRLFGLVRFAREQEIPDWWAGLAPSLLERGFSRTKLLELLRRYHRRPLKSVLLLQQAFPGVGNWMADEILWRAGLQPERASTSVTAPEAARLHATTKTVCRKALASVGKDFSDPPAGWLFHERWKRAGVCPRHGTGLHRKAIGGRTTVWCNACQS